MYLSISGKIFSATMAKRSLQEFLELSSVDKPTQHAKIHGLVASLSPMKKSKVHALILMVVSQMAHRIYDLWGLMMSSKLLHTTNKRLLRYLIVRSSQVASQLRWR